MATLRKGSTGQDVRELQTALNGKGYTLSVDGIYGDKTAAAVRDYQQKNGLSMVDGIAGNETCILYITKAVNIFFCALRQPYFIV